MSDLFDISQSQKLKTEGISAAAHGGDFNLLKIAQEIAVRLALDSPLRECNADAVGEALARRNLPMLGPAAGALFKGKGWEFTGRRKKSCRVSNHAREIKIWRLVPPWTR
jgi:hypothetical protein|tara:strand:- start:1372 stop:1701 length:330 start_codon:yes stop_codon:yes gene_type:complete